MTQFKSQSDLVRDKLDENADAIAAAERDAADSPEAAIKLVQLQARRRQLEHERDRAEQDERDRDLAKQEAARASKARALAQHCSALRRAAEDIAGSLAKLSEDYTSAVSALGRIAACVGDTRPYNDLHANTLRRLVTRELWRASAVPTIEGDRSPLVETPHGAGAAHTTPSLVDTVAALTRHWAAIHRAATGLVGRGNAAPTDDTGAGE